MKGQLLDAARRKEAAGVHGITGSCGFLALLQRDIAEAISIPVFVSSLIQLPMVYQMTRALVGVLTASAAALTDKHLSCVGAAGVPIEIQGMQEAEEFATVILRNERKAMDISKIENELLRAGKALIQRAPNIRAIVLECTDLPPYAHELQKALQRPVFDPMTLSTMMHDVLHRQKYAGFT